MKAPVVVTFVDKKMLYLAEEQAKNVQNFGLEHVIYHIDNVETYNSALWLKLNDLTIEAIKKYDKILKLDAEVRLHKNLPKEWLIHDNVIFQPYPLHKDPFFLAANTGQIILSKSGLNFLHIIKECTLAMLPPNDDSKLYSKEKNFIDDEWLSCIAIRLSKIDFKQEYICYDRKLNANCSANRGLWVESNTVLTHQGLHNWELEGAGQFWDIKNINYNVFINHFGINKSIKEVEFVANLLVNKIFNKNLWNKIASKIDDNHYKIDNWIFNPKKGLVALEGHSFKLMTK